MKLNRHQVKAALVLHAILPFLLFLESGFGGYLVFIVLGHVPLGASSQLSAAGGAAIMAFLLVRGIARACGAVVPDVG